MAACEITSLGVSVYEVPTDGPEGKELDGTQEWSSTTMVIVEAHAGDKVGLGYTYADVSAAHLIESKLAGEVLGKDAFMVPSLYRAQKNALRNVGRPGIGMMALSAVDIALWELKAKLLGLPLFQLLGAFHDRVPVYGSGGFCNYSIGRLLDQVTGWREQGVHRIKIKTSRHPEDDADRLSACRRELGSESMLMTDANGALTRKQALYWAHRFREEWDVIWFEEPVSSDDREGLRLLRDQGPPGLDIAAGEYGFIQRDFVDLLQSGAVDCLQADVTRCGGLTGLMQIAGLASSHGIDLSAHCAPAVSAHAFCGVEHLRHLEFFHDHARIERMFFEGTLSPNAGAVKPDPSRPGLGLQFKRKDAEHYRIYGH